MTGQVKRHSTARHAPLNYAQRFPKADRPPTPKRREFGASHLFFFKMFGCFTPDNLPPPNPNATIYQAGKSSSSSITMTNSTSTTNRTSPHNTPPKTAAPPAPRKNSLSRPHSKSMSSSPVTPTPVKVPSAPRVQFPTASSQPTSHVASRPASQPPSKPASQPASQLPTRPMSHPAPLRTADRPPQNYIQRSPKPTAPLHTPQSEQPKSTDDSVETRKMVGNVSRLSAMFQQE